MPKKNLDGNGRLRSVTIGFRVSPEENESINMRVRLSGLTKQDYITRRCQEQDIVVIGNPRVYKALRKELTAVHQQLERLQTVSELDESLRETLHILAVTLYGLKQEVGQ